jgi:hypothetical protein
VLCRLQSPLQWETPVLSSHLAAALRARVAPAHPQMVAQRIPGFGLMHQNIVYSNPLRESARTGDEEMSRLPLHIDGLTPRIVSVQYGITDRFSKTLRRATGAPPTDSFRLLCAFGSASARIISPVMSIVSRFGTITYKPGFRTGWPRTWSCSCCRAWCTASRRGTDATANEEGSFARTSVSTGTVGDSSAKCERTKPRAGDRRDLERG